MAFKIGSLYIDVSVRKPGVDADLDQTKAKLEEVGESGKQASDKVSGGLAGVGKAAKSAQAAISKILIPAAIATALAAIVDRFKEAVREARAFESALKDISRESSAALQADASAGKLNDAQRQLADLNAQQAAADERRAAALEAAVEAEKSSLGTLRNQIAQLFTDAPVTQGAKARAAEEESRRDEQRFIQRRAILNRQIAEQDAQDRIDANAKVYEAERKAQDDLLQLSQERRRAEAANIEDPIARIAAEAAVEIESLTKKFLDARDEATKREYDSMIAAAERSAEIRIAGERQVMAEAAKRAEDDARRAARAYADELKKALDDLSGIFGDTGVGFGSFRRELQTLNSELRAADFRGLQMGGHR